MSRSRWEGAFRGALPKQLMPYLMLRYATVCGFRDGIREAALLCRAWGVAKQHVVHAVIAAAYYKNGIYSSAIDLLTEATKSAPQNSTYHYHLGLAYQKSNQVELAKANFRRALELDPKSPRANEIRQALLEWTSN